MHCIDRMEVCMHILIVENALGTIKDKHNKELGRIDIRTYSDEILSRNDGGYLKERE